MRKSLYFSFAAIFMAASCGNSSSADMQQMSAADLQSVAGDGQTRSFYEARQWRPAWNAQLEEQLLEALRGASAHGLDAQSLLAPIDGKEGAARETALTNAALALADALADGQLDPDRVFEIYTIPRPRVDLVAQLNRAVEQGRVADWLGGLAPDDAEYRALSTAYLRAMEQPGRDMPRIEGAGLIREGETDPRVPAIRRLLAMRGYLGEVGVTGPAEAQTVYTSDIADAVRAAQRDHGLAVDGIVGPDTIAVISSGPRERARQLAVNLERRRWLERMPPPTRIDVNSAAAHLDFWRDGEHADRRLVVVGQPGWETPQLQSPIFRLVANPTWTVPKSIEREEIATRGAAYLRRNNMVRRDGWIVQLPGPDNALGQVKFDMRNDFAIYLHDTPAKHLFGRDQRHFSHGCIRVQDALGFARRLAELDGKLDGFEAAQATGDETFVNLDRSIPVRLIYHTVFLGQDGALTYLLDPYGWDDRIAAELGLGDAGPNAPAVHVDDVGP